MNITQSNDMISIEINGNGADFYADGTISPWTDGNALFNQCEATGDIRPKCTQSEAMSAVNAALDAFPEAPYKIGTIFKSEAEVLA